MRAAAACERRAAAAGWQVALAAAKFARLWILDWTLVRRCVRWKCPPPTHNQGPYDTALKCASNFTPLKLGASFWRLSTSRKALDARLSTHG